MLKAVAVLMLALLPLAAVAADGPSAECVLSTDKSSVEVIASNSSELAYKCMATCKANVTGQQAFQPVSCNFNLAKGAAEKAVCSKAGGAPNFFKAISPTRYTCVPRN